jgi:hypothetical protein
MSAQGYGHGPNAHNAASHCCYSLAEFEVGRISLRASCMPGRKRYTGSIGTRGMNPVGQRSHGLLCHRREALAASFPLQVQLREYLSHCMSHSRRRPIGTCFAMHALRSPLYALMFFSSNQSIASQRLPSSSKDTEGFLTLFSSSGPTKGPSAAPRLNHQTMRAIDTNDTRRSLMSCILTYANLGRLRRLAYLCSLAAAVLAIVD